MELGVKPKGFLTRQRTLHHVQTRGSALVGKSGFFVFFFYFALCQGSRG